MARRASTRSRPIARAAAGPGGHRRHDAAPRRLRPRRGHPRRRAHAASLPVILLSARAGEEARIEGLGAGADDYLVKPFSARELLARVGAQLALARQRRELERRSRYRSEQFETLLNEAPLGVYLVDEDFRIRRVNPIALPVFGDIPGGVEGRDLRPRSSHLLWRAGRTQTSSCGIFRHTLATGESHVTRERAELRRDRGVVEYYEWQVDRIPLPGGQRGVVCYFRDISAQVVARTPSRRPRGAEGGGPRKDEFLATLAHELRNPLAPMRNALQILRLAGARRRRRGAACTK